MTTVATYRKRKEALVAALRSGEYEQTTGYLREGNAFCCLGVACDVSDLGAWDNEKYMDALAILPEEVCLFYGFAGNEGRTDSGESLSGRNDSGASFAEIADWIDSEPAGMFTWSGE